MGEMLSKKDTLPNAKAISDLLYKSCLGIGVVFLALVTTIPTAWETPEVRSIYVAYLQWVTVSLFGAMALLLVFSFRKHVEGWPKNFLLYGGFFGLFAFAISTIIMTWRLAKALAIPSSP